MSRSQGETTAETVPDALRRLQVALDGSDDEDIGRQTQTADRMLSAARSTIAPDGNVDFDEPFVKDNLAELLLMLVATRSAEANGKRLREDLDHLFGADISPGTAYPELYDLEEAGLLEHQELVRTKEYFIDDESAARETISSEMEQHLVLALFYRNCLETLWG